MYSLQEDRNGNRIVCRGDEPRTGYVVIATGTYGAMTAERAALDLAAPSVRARRDAIGGRR